ncbi:hypothetical protein HTZ85_25300 [Escherichia coli]|nr:hypothetical protein [Escherichia coli]
MSIKPVAIQWGSLARQGGEQSLWIFWRGLAIRGHVCCNVSSDVDIHPSGVNATMFDRYLPFSCPLNTFVTDAVRFAPFHHH